MKQIVLSVLVTLLLLSLPSLSWSAKCSSSASGLWSSPSTWACGEVPVFGTYSAVVSSGHTVTIDDSRTIPATMVGTLAAGKTGQLVVGHPANDITVTAAGPLVLMTNTNINSRLTLTAGTTLDMGANPLVLGANLATTARWDFLIRGTAERRVSVTGSGSIASPTGSLTRGGIDWQYATIDGFGGSANNLNAYHGVILDNCLFKGAGEWSFGGAASRIDPVSPLAVSNTDFRTGKGLKFFLTNGVPTGVRSVSRTTFVAAATGSPRPFLTIQANTAYGGYLTFTDCVFYHYGVTEMNTGRNSYDRCAFYAGPSSDGGSSHIMLLHGGGSTVKNSLAYVSNVNNHGFIGGATTTPLGADLFDNLVMENLYNWNSANLFIPARHAGTTVRNVLTIGTGMMPITVGLRASAAAASSAVNSYVNNTFTSSGNGYYWENGTPGTPQNGTNIYRNNLHYATETSTAGMLEGSSTGPGSGGHLDDADYNGFFRAAGVTTPLIANLALANWQEETRGSISYVSPTSFTITGVDVTGTYTAGKPLSIRIGDKRAWVRTDGAAPSTFAGGVTTVNLNPLYAALTAGLTQVYYHTSDKVYGVEWGAHDIIADPKFKDPTRTLSRYTGSTAVALFEELVKGNGFDVAGNPAVRSTSWSTTDAMAWLREGFMPTNPVLATAADNGGPIGAVAPRVTLSVTLAGDGGGVVNSDPTGFTCGSGACFKSYSPATSLILIASPDANSLFTCWEDPTATPVTCTAGESHSVTMNSDINLRALFAAVPPVRIAGKTPAPYQKLQAGCDKASPNDVIQVREVMLAEEVVLARDITLEIRGGI